MTQHTLRATDPLAFFAKSPPWQDHLTDLAVLFLITAPILLLVWHLLGRPGPRIYARFIRVFVGVQVKHKAFGGMRQAYWLPTFYATLFVSSFSYMAVHTNLRYPLLIDALGYSVLQVGLIDAASQGAALILDFLLARYYKSLTRDWIFAFSAVATILAYVNIIGELIPWAQQLNASQLVTIICVILGQALANLRLEDQEFQIMRSEAADDMCEHAHREGLGEWQSPSSIACVLSTFQSVLRYPASILATAVFTPMVRSHQTFQAYFCLGIMGGVFSGFLAVSWNGHQDVQRVPSETSTSTSTSKNSQPMCVRRKSSLDRPVSAIQDHWEILVEVGILDATLQLLKSGFPRLLQLTVLKSGNSDTDLSVLMITVFAVSLCFFWLSSSVQADKISLVSFALLGSGHFLMGVASVVSSYRGMIISTLVFGLGQATSTGLRTNQKDKIREMIRREGGSKRVEKFIMRVSGGIVTTSLLLNSVFVGIIGQNFGMPYVSFAYFILALGGGAWSFYLNQCRRDEDLGYESLHSDSSRESIQL